MLSSLESKHDGDSTGRDVTWMPRVAVSDGQRLETTSNRHIVTARAPLAITSAVLSATSPPPLYPLNPKQIHHTYRKDAYRSLVRRLL
jgi:hypothetical protein